ncbi:hypothetical protein [Acidovorax sp. BLS4]|uniref:hypothetical protein n=1 Tax=Acidovorax sp. BLS4 TaxID=3273430 RepID=UPI0029426551|nr:hypothetical protein [Paracidovorax avenae]WOI47689.1 hypothetical protein R1Z03_10950 [Paracidovorax avenae]
MAAARYWRLAAVRPWGLGALSISEAALYTASGRADASATLTSRMAPTMGGLAALQDGSAAAVVNWSASQVAAPGWALIWEFPAAVEIVCIAIGGGATQATYPCDLRVESSPDGAAWTALGEVGGLLFPGPYTLGSVDDLRQHVFSMDFNGGAITEAYGHPVTVHGGAHIESTSPLIDGTPYLSLAGGEDYLEFPNAADLALGNSYEIGFDLRVPSGSTVGAIWHQGYYNADALSWPSPGISIRLLDDRLRFYFYATSYADEQYLDVQYTPNVAQRWRMVRSGGDGAVIRDGAQVAARSGLGTLPAPTRPLQIGRWTFSHGTPTMVARLDNLYADSALQLAKAGTARVLPTSGSGARVISGGPVPDAGVPSPGAARLARDMEFGGLARIWGTTKIKGAVDVPTRSRVLLLRQRDKLVAREVWSDPVTGAFEFVGLDAGQQWLVLAEDQAGNYRPVAASRLEAQP